MRVKLLHYLKNDILKDYHDKILSDCDINEVDLQNLFVDGDLPTQWWDEDADKSLLVGIFKHGHDKFNSMRQDPCLCFLKRCGPPNKEELMAEINLAEKNEDLDDENRDVNLDYSARYKILDDGHSLDSDASHLLNRIIDSVSHEIDDGHEAIVDENKNSILKTEKSDSMPFEQQNSIIDAQSTATESSSANQDQNDYLPFPTSNELNQRFRKLITAYQRNSKKLEIQLAQKARDELKRERTSKFEAAKNEREERKRFLAQKWSRREEADFFRAISSFGVEYDPILKRHDWNKFRSIGKLEKKLDDTLEEYYKAFLIMCKKVTSRPLSEDEEKCLINVDPVTEERASRCLSRIELLNKIREQVMTHPELDERLKLCVSQSDLPDWWENGRHDKDLLVAAAKHGLTRLDYNLAHDPTLSFNELIKQKVHQFFHQPPTPILIPVEQLQELLDINGIEYVKDVNQRSDAEDVKNVINSIIEAIELENSAGDDNDRSGSSQMNSQSKGSRPTPCPPPRSLPSILTRRGPNTVVRSANGAGPNPASIRLEHTTRFDDRGVIEITPLIPDNLPEDPPKTFEAGEISVTIHSESALLQMDSRAPIILFGATNPVTAKIRWPKDKAIQTRLENIVQLVERNEWPTPQKPPVPIITLPNHLANPLSTAPNPVISSPSKTDKTDISIGSPKSDTSNLSSRIELKETNDTSGSRGRRGRGRRSKQSEIDDLPIQPPDLEHPKDDRQAAAKLRNLLSQHPKSSRSNNPGTSEKLTAKFGGNKQGPGLSSLLKQFKENRTDSCTPSTSVREEKDFNAPDLIPNLFNLKPELREAATSFLLNMNSGVSGNSKANSANDQLLLDNLLKAARSTEGPPPAHQRPDNLPAAHGSSSRELRRSAQREGSPPSLNLRSTRGKGSLMNMQSLSHQKPVEHAHVKPTVSGSSKRRGRPSSNITESPHSLSGGDILDLSSLPIGRSLPNSRSELRSRRLKDQNDESPQTVSTRSSTTPTKASLKMSSKSAVGDHEVEQAPEVEMRTTRARKRIGSRIDALALNLQAKRMNRGDSPSDDMSPPSIPSKDKNGENSSVVLGSQKSHESRSSRGPPVAHSGTHKSGTTQSDQRSEKPTPLTSAANISNTNPQPALRSDNILTQLMSNPTSLLAALNPIAGAGDLMLRKPGTSDIIKNLMNEFIKNPSLALDPSILATLSSSIPLSNQTLPGFNLQTPTSVPSTSSKGNSSMINDFKSPSSNITKRTRMDSVGNSSRQNLGGGVQHNERRSSTTPDRKSNDKRVSHPDRLDRGSSKHDRRSGSSGSQEADAQSKRSSSLLAQQTTANQQSHVSTAPISSQSTFPNASTLNLANQFGGLNSLSNMLNFSGLNELMKQMTNFSGSATLPRVSNASSPMASSAATSSGNGQSADKNLRRSRQSTQPPPVSTSQQSANSVLANSLMNLAPQSNPAANPYGNFMNPLTNPLLTFGLGNLGLNTNSLGMGLFPNLYMPPGFPTTEPQSSQIPSQPSNSTSDNSQKDRKLRFPRK